MKKVTLVITFPLCQSAPRAVGQGRECQLLRGRGGCLQHTYSSTSTAIQPSAGGEHGATRGRLQQQVCAMVVVLACHRKYLMTTTTFTRTHYAVTHTCTTTALTPLLSRDAVTLLLEAKADIAAKDYVRIFVRIDFSVCMSQ